MMLNCVTWANVSAGVAPLPLISTTKFVLTLPKNIHSFFPDASTTAQPTTVEVASLSRAVQLYLQDVFLKKENWISIAEKIVTIIIIAVILQPLAWTSVFWNGIIGITKIVVALNFNKSDMNEAQLKLYEGIYMCMVAVADLIIALVACMLVLPLIYYVWNEETAHSHFEKCFGPLKVGRMPEDLENISILEGFAYKITKLCLQEKSPAL